MNVLGSRESPQTPISKMFGRDVRLEQIQYTSAYCCPPSCDLPPSWVTPCRCNIYQETQDSLVTSQSISSKRSVRDEFSA